MTKINHALQEQSRNHPNKKGERLIEQEGTFFVCPIAQEFRLSRFLERREKERNEKRKTVNFKKNGNP
jgi:hypothetical protein